VIPELIAQFVDTGKIRYVYRDFPLNSIHPAAQKARSGGMRQAVGQVLGMNGNCCRRMIGVLGRSVARFEPTPRAEPCSKLTSALIQAAAVKVRDLLAADARGKCHTYFCQRSAHPGWAA
jgi:hypothetical protein